MRTRNRTLLRWGPGTGYGSAVTTVHRTQADRQPHAAHFRCPPQTGHLGQDTFTRPLARTTIPCFAGGWEGRVVFLLWITHPLERTHKVTHGHGGGGKRSERSWDSVLRNDGNETRQYPGAGCYYTVPRIPGYRIRPHARTMLHKITLKLMQLAIFATPDDPFSKFRSASFSFGLRLHTPLRGEFSKANKGMNYFTVHTWRR